jgi:hypothetical protein
MEERNNPPVLKRRLLLGGAGTVGALAAAVALMPKTEPQTAAVDGLKTPPEQGGGYQVTDHVLRYYRTTKV